MNLYERCFKLFADQLWNFYQVMIIF